ncbi:MAG: heavy metal translocating P-type ATPase [Oscillospiraceae bacterium]|nr:heavy metal translocating P-type ATPase [Oscillospiraceae bacterium]
MTRKQKKILIRVIISAVLLAAVRIINPHGIIAAASYIVPFLVIGWDVLYKAGRNILHGQIFDENFLMSIAATGAFFTGDYTEGAAVMLFYQIGELFQSYAVGKSRKSIASLMDIRPDYANIEVDSHLQQVDPSQVKTGDIIVIKASEKVPLDGIIIEGRSSLDTSAITGESVPRDVYAGDDVISGCINKSGVLRVQVTKEYSESTASRILDLVENASNKKSKSENFISRFSRVYTPVVVILAVMLAVIGGILTKDFSVWIHRALIFLVVSCPCALVISVPLSFFGGIGGASRCGILIKGGNYMDTLSKADVVVFDKTGTLTKGVFNVTAVHPESVSQHQLLETAVLAESYSEHPISRSLRDAYGESPDKSRIGELTELSGRGIKAVIDSHSVLVGNSKLMEEAGVMWHPCHHTGTTVHVAIDGKYEGHIVISDEIKEESADAVKQLKSIGISKTVMLTGDIRKVGENVASRLGIDEVFCELLPEGKVSCLEKLLADKKENSSLVFVGDGLNDAPVLMRADIGMAMGAIGSDAAIEASDVVLMDDNPAKIAASISISKKTLRIVHQNIAFALTVKLLILLLGAIGYAGMWAAVFADVGVSVLAILNAARALNMSEYK